MTIWHAVIGAVFAWWFFTGVILLGVRWADQEGMPRHHRLVFLAVPIAALGVAGALLSRDATGAGGAAVGFMSALLLWGWIELAFLTGVVAGPERGEMPQGARGRARFRHAWHTVSHHETALLAGLVVLLLVSAGAQNLMALYAYGVLFVARVSAKLNLFYGVPRINVEFVPRPLAHLVSCFRQGPPTWAFAAGVTVLTAALALMIWALTRATTPGEIAQWTLLSALTALALLEHWLMVLPLPDAKLWRWMLPARPPEKTQEERH